MFTDNYYNENMNKKKLYNACHRIYIKTFSEEEQREVRIIIDTGTSNCLKLNITDESDPRFMFTLSLNSEDYQLLQAEQGLLLAFDAFPKKLVRLLEQCLKGEMFVKINQASPSEWIMQFIERNEFKHLVYLQLSVSRSSDAELIKYMSAKIRSLSEMLSQSNKNCTAKEENMKVGFEQKDSELRKMAMTLENYKEESKRREFEHQKTISANHDRTMKERDEWQREQEIRFDNKIKDLQNDILRKTTEIERYKLEVSNQSDKIFNIEKLNRDQLSKVQLLESEINTIRLELNATKLDVNKAHRDVQERDKQLQSVGIKQNEMQKMLQTKEDELSKANASLNNCKQDIVNAETKITEITQRLNSKCDGLRITATELCKANEIISKQICEIQKLKEKVQRATEIAFVQEKLIEKNESVFKECEIERDELKKQLEDLNKEKEGLSKKLEEAQNKCAEKDKTLDYNATMIKWMQKRLEDNQGNADGVPRLTTTTPGTPVYSAFTPRIITTTVQPPSYQQTRPASTLSAEYLKPTPRAGVAPLLNSIQPSTVTVRQQVPASIGSAFVSARSVKSKSSKSKSSTPDENQSSAANRRVTSARSAPSPSAYFPTRPT